MQPLRHESEAVDKPDKPSRLDVEVISLDLFTPIRDNILRIFPTAKPFQAIDMRQVNPDLLRKSDLITFSSLDTLRNGRKWHKELSSSGAVGIHQTNRILLANGSGPVLILEEDCNLSPNIHSHVNELLRNQNKFDVAVFGGVVMECKSKDSVDFLPPGWKKIKKGLFVLMHCVLYSTKGRQKVAKYLDSPQEVQIDAFLSFLNNEELIDLVIYDSKDLAWQTVHLSSIQESMGTCALCSVPARAGAILKVILWLLLVGTCAAAAVQVYKRRNAE